MGIVRHLQALVGSPVHPLRFATRQVQNACVPTQPFADRVCPTVCTVVGLFRLGLVGEFVAVPARIHLAAEKTEYDIQRLR